MKTKVIFTSFVVCSHTYCYSFIHLKVKCRSKVSLEKAFLCVLCLWTSPIGQGSQEVKTYSI